MLYLTHQEFMLQRLYKGWLFTFIRTQVHVIASVDSDIEIYNEAKQYVIDYFFYMLWDQP